MPVPFHHTFHHEHTRYLLPLPEATLSPSLVSSPAALWTADHIIWQNIHFNKRPDVWRCLMRRLQASLSLKNTVCQLEACSPCVSHKGTKDSATVTDCTLHTAPASLRERVHVPFCGGGSFMLSFLAETEGERQASSLLSSKNTNPICSGFIVVPFQFFLKDNKLVIYLLNND